MKERYLFLDIDGVINTLMIYKEPVEGRSGKVKKDGYYFDLCYPSDGRVSNLQALYWLEKLCLEYNLKVVITSTWMVGHSLQEIKECLYNSGFSRDVEIIDNTSQNLGQQRGWNIEAWLNKNKLKLKDIAILILDDDSDMLGMTINFTKYLVKCKTHIGFTHYEYVESVNLLDSQLED